MRQRKPTKQAVMKAYDELFNALQNMMNAQQKLSAIVSEYYGKNICADVCNGFEVEFRTIDENGDCDDFTHLTIDDILDYR